MAYGDNVFGATHRWSFNNVLTDSIGSLTVSNTGGSFVASPICRDSTHSYQTNGRDDLATVAPGLTAGSGTDNDILAVGGWFQVSDIQGPPCMVMKIGGNTAGMHLFIWGGNTLTAQIRFNGGTQFFQIYSSKALTSNRPYHFLMKFEGTDYGDEFSFYIDGVKQASASSTATGLQFLDAFTGAYTWGENGSTGTEVNTGDDTVLTKACVNGLYAEWWVWHRSTPTDQQIYENVFGEGAIPTITITSDTEANMQTQLDTYIGQSSGDTPLAFLIEEVSGGGDLNLSLSNYDFSDPNTSIHVRYEGTGTLNWTNAGTSNATLKSGNVNFINPSTATFTGLVTGAEFRIYIDNGTEDYGAELDGVEVLSGTTFQYSHSGATQNIIAQLIADNYVEGKLQRTLSSNDQTFQFNPELETNT